MDNIESVISQFPGREAQIRILCRLIPDSNNIKRTGSFRIIGSYGSGKSAILRKVFELKKKSFVFVNCYECRTPGMVYQKILRESFNQNVQVFDGSVTSFSNFCSVFERATREFGPLPENFFYLVLKYPYILDTEIIENFMRLERDTHRQRWKLRTILVQETFDFRIDSNSYTIYFPEYNMDELTQILLLKRPQYPVNLYTSFLTVFLRKAYNVDRNLLDLLQMVDPLFAMYKKPIDEGKCTDENLAVLFKHFSNFLSLKIDNIFSPMDRFEFAKENEPISAEKFMNHLELPYCAKYLLIASFLASYIPPKLDKLIFSKQSSRRKKQANVDLYKDTRINYLSGPKSFPLRRLIMIYLSIVGNRTKISAREESQIGTLVDLKLIVNSEKCIDLSNPKYKCVAKEGIILHLARNVNFDISKYLPVSK